MFKFKKLRELNSPQAKVLQESGKEMVRKMAFEGALKTNAPKEKNKQIERAFVTIEDGQSQDAFLSWLKTVNKYCEVNEEIATSRKRPSIQDTPTEGQSLCKSACVSRQGSSNESRNKEQEENNDRCVETNGHTSTMGAIEQA